MKVSKEQFACKAIELLFSMKYFNQNQVRDQVEALQDHYDMQVEGMTTDELEEYVSEEIRLLL